jgi:hypothetical protein
MVTHLCNYVEKNGYKRFTLSAPGGTLNACDGASFFNCGSPGVGANPKVVVVITLPTHTKCNLGGDISPSAP